MRRVFLVGCPRSGTTLMQTMLAQHPDIFTVPETHYFRKIRGRFGDRHVGPLVSPRAAARALDGLATATQTAERPAVPRWWPGAGRYLEAFVEAMDQAASSAGASTWLEKSPVHLHHLGEIEQSVPGVSVLHLVRDGRDVVASLVDLCERDPELWVPQLSTDTAPSSRRQLIDAAVRRWNTDVRSSMVCLDRANHHLTIFSALATDPAATLERVTELLGLPYEPAMERHWEAADRVVGHRRNERHMSMTFQPVDHQPLKRFHDVFDADERTRIQASLLGGGDPGAALVA